MSTPGIRKVSSGITNRLNGMLDRNKALRAYLARNVYRQYQKAQMDRWESQGSTEGKKWAPLTERYAREKLKRFADYPGRGTKMLVAKSRLLPSVIGPSPEHRLLVEDRMIAISSAVPYAEYVDHARKFSGFGKATDAKILNGVKQFLIWGEE